MPLQTLILVSLSVLLFAAIIYIVHLRRESDKYLFRIKPLKLENEKLQEENARLSAKLSPEERGGSAGAKGAKKSKKNNVKPDVNPAELSEKILELKAEIAKLKQKNYDLDLDNKNLRTGIKEHTESHEEGAHVLVELRDQISDLTVKLRESEGRNAILASQLKDSISQQTSEQMADEEADNRIAVLECDNMKLRTALKSAQNDLVNFKRDFKNELESAKKEVANNYRALKKQVSQAENQAAQSKKRADNDHKLYLIARAQLILAEKILQKNVPGQKLPIALPASSEAIEELIKKMAAQDARAALANRDMADLNDKVKKLETENETLKSEQKSGLSMADIGAFDDDNDALSALVNEFNVSLPPLVGSPTVIMEAASDTEVRKDSTSAKPMADLDLSKLDADWDSL